MGINHFNKQESFTRNVDVSVIIVNYKTHDLVCSAVQSIIKSTSGCSVEIIVVDNSVDDCEFRALKNDLPETVIAIKQDCNLGFGSANNYGAKNASGKYLFLLNSDTLLINNAICELFLFLESHPNAGVAGSNLFSLDYKPCHSFYKNVKSVKAEKRNNSLVSILFRKINKKRSDFNYSDAPLKVDGYVCGAALMIRKECFEKIGGFDERIFMYGEEALLCYRVIHELKMDIYNIPSSKIIHFEGSSFGTSFSVDKAKRMVDGNFVYFNIVFGKKQTIKYLKQSIRIYKRNRFFMALTGRKERSLFFSALVKATEEKVNTIK